MLQHAESSLDCFLHNKRFIRLPRLARKGPIMQATELAFNKS